MIHKFKFDDKTPPHNKQSTPTNHVTQLPEKSRTPQKSNNKSAKAHTTPQQHPKVHGTLEIEEEEL